MFSFKFLKDKIATSQWQYQIEMNKYLVIWSTHLHENKNKTTPPPVSILEKNRILDEYIGIFISVYLLTSQT